MLALDPVDQKVVDDVARYGWHVVMVASRADDEPKEIPFAYTVGLHSTFGWPELICFGLEPKKMAGLLNDTVKELQNYELKPAEMAVLLDKTIKNWQEKPVPPVSGLNLFEVAKGYVCQLYPVATQHHAEYLRFATWYIEYRGQNPDDIRCLQLVWPDQAGLYPDNPDCAEGVRKLQPLLLS